MKNLILLGLAISLALFSCKDDDDAQAPIDTPVVDPIEDEAIFLPLTEGNYWIYENVQVEPDGTESLFGTTPDSIYVAGDSLINGITYTLIRGRSSLYGNSSDTTLLNIVRESSGDIINVNGRTILSTTNFTDILWTDTIPKSEDPIFIIEYSMKNIEETVSVPAGTFNDVINSQGRVLVRPTTLVDSVRYIDNLYADGIGTIFSTNFFSSTNNVLESRLLRYNVQ